MPRDFHTKAHGCVAAKFEVLGGLPREYRHGLFAGSGHFEAVVRFSNGTRDPGSDRTPNSRGMAIKVVLPGEPLNQDFLLANYPVNLVKNVEESYSFYKAEAANKPQTYMLYHPRSLAIGALGAIDPVADLFDETYFSQTPYRLGPNRACKYVVTPAGEPPAEWLKRKERAKKAGDGPDYLREKMTQRIGEKRPIAFDFHVQRQLHPMQQPIENASFEWDLEASVPLKVATLTLKPDEEIAFSSPEHQWHAEILAFNPRNALPEHAPIGGMNRLRVAAYDKISELRHAANGIEAPTGAYVMPPPRLPS